MLSQFQELSVRITTKPSGGLPVVTHLREGTDMIGNSTAIHEVYR